MEIVRRVINGWNYQEVERILAFGDIARSTRGRKPA